jgi:hypothetical protein
MLGQPNLYISLNSVQISFCSPLLTQRPLCSLTQLAPRGEEALRAAAAHVAQHARVLVPARLLLPVEDGPVAQHPPRCRTEETPMNKWRINRNVRVRHGATENGPCTRDKSQTFAVYVQPSVRATNLSRGIGGRRETAARADLPPEIPHVAIRNFCTAVRETKRTPPQA